MVDISKQVVINWMRFLQGLIGFALGFIFSGAIAERIAGFIHGSAGTLPTQIPILTDLLIAGGGIGIFVVFILILLGIKTFKFFSTFVSWLIIGILASMIMSFLGMRIGEMLEGVWPF